ncbi:MAG: hypothetical protein O6848_11420, partial [Bacteroidetes bacterium]|nr:hypothetical protein [Bacteroidota bacterium]
CMSRNGMKMASWRSLTLPSGCKAMENQFNYLTGSIKPGIPMDSSNTQPIIIWVNLEDSHCDLN